MTFDFGDYLRTHLRYELKYLLVGATTWRAVRPEEDRALHPPHLVVMATESTFVHTRVLYEFLTHDHGWAGRAVHAPLTSQLWTDYKAAIHSKVLHPGANRPYAPTGTRADQLKEMVMEFAQDILRLWTTATADPRMSLYRGDMVRVQNDAVADAREVADWFDIPLEFSEAPVT